LIVVSIINKLFLVSVDGSLCVWNLSDGRCMALSPYILSDSPTSIVSLPGGNQVACSGKHNNIEIVDLKQLKVIRRIEGHTEWVKSLSSGVFKENSEQPDRTVMLSVGEDSTLRYWVFEQTRDKTSLDTNAIELGAQLPSYSVDSQTPSPLCVSHSSDWGYVIVVSEKRWVVFAYQGYKPLFIVDAPENEILKGGLFIDSQHVLIYAQSGDGYVYRLPLDSSSTTSRRAVAPRRLQQQTHGTQMISTIPPLLTKSSNKAYHDEHSSDEEDHGLNDEWSIVKNEYQHSTGRPEDNSVRSTLQQHGDANHQRTTSLYNTVSNVLGAFGIKRKDSHESLPQLAKSPVRTKSPPPAIRTTSPLRDGSAVRKSPSVNEFPRTRSTDMLRKSPSAQDMIKKSISSQDLQDNKQPSLTVNTSLPTSISPSLSPRTPVISDYDTPDTTTTGGDFTSIGAAIERATRTSIFDSNNSMSPQSILRQQPVLIKHLQEEENVKASLGTSVWRSQGNFVLRADTNGNLRMWKININKLVSPDEEPSKLAEQITVDQISTSTLAAGWPEPVRALKNTRITCSHFAIDKDRTPKLIHGYLDGTIGVFPSSVSEEEPVMIKAHSMKVTSLLVVDDEENDRRLLVSGSADYSVKLWILATGELLQEFNYHSGAVNLIFLPPKSIRKKLQNCFCSVSEDRSVILYSIRTMEVLNVLGGHSSSVLSVYWRVDMDYLLVRCSDGSVYVWQLSTGLLERRVFGKVAAELIERSEGPGSSRRPTVKISFSKQSAYTEKSKGFLESVSLTVNDTEPDVQLLMLSVRRLIGYVNSKREAIRDTVKSDDPNIQQEQQMPLQQSPQDSYADFSESYDSENPKKLPYSLICALAYVLQYGNHESLTELRKLLRIESPEPVAYIGLKGAGDTFSLIVPKASDRSHPFIFSPVLSALHTISCVSILNALAAIPPLKDKCNQCIKYYLNDMQNDFEEYEDPSFLWCAQFLKDTSKEIQNAARAVMAAVLQRMDLPQLKILAEKLACMLLDSQTESTGAASTTRKQNIVVALAILAYKQPKAVDGRIASITAMGLIEILERGGPQHTTAISLLGDGYSIWQYYIPDAPGFCRQLFQLSLPALAARNLGATKTASQAPNQDTLANDALQAFINMASVDTREYIEFITAIVSNAQQTSTTTLSAAITSLYPLIHHHPECLIDHLVTVTGLLLKVLDPHFPSIRDICMPASTNILRYMVEIYPMVSFHQERQKLAVGNTDGYVVIYDMRTASKWQLFEAHKSPVAAVSFSPNGEMLCTFSPREYACKLWNTDGSGVLNLLGVGSRAIKTFEVPSAKAAMKPIEILKYVKFDWNGPRSFTLKPGKNLNKQSFGA
jgi:WD40 repeat protein